MHVRENLKSRLEEYMCSTTLVPAAIDSGHEIMNWGRWTRDEYYRAIAQMWGVKEGIINCHQILYDKAEKKGKFDYSDTDWSKDGVYLHAVHDENLEEITLHWPHHQNDIAGNYLEMFSWAKDKRRAEGIRKYLEVIEYWHNACYGFWERYPKKIRASSIASCLRGLHAYEMVFGSTKQTKKMIDLGYQVLESILPNETLDGRADLALLSIIYPGKLNPEIITPYVKEQIIANVMPLVGDYGINRFKGDPWDGMADTLSEGNEMEWAFLSWLYICTNEKKYLIRNRELKKEFATLPEGFNDGKPNCTPCLIWTESMNVIAERINLIRKLNFLPFIKTI